MTTETAKQPAFLYAKEATQGKRVSPSSQRPARRLSRAVSVLVVAITAIQGCSEGATYPTWAGPAPGQTAGGSFSITAAPTGVTVLQGGGGEFTIDIARTGGFTGNVVLAVMGAPSGFAVTINPGSTAGKTATLLVSTLASSPTGVFALTITGSASGQADQTVTVRIDVASYTGGEGNVTVDFSTCPADNRPVWFAFQDGAGPWTQVLGASDRYRFDVASAKGGYASAGKDGLSVIFATRAELTGSTQLPCGTGALTKAISGTLTGLGINDVAYVSMGGGYTSREGPVIGTSFTMTGVQEGAQDLIAYRSDPRSMGDGQRVIIRRDQNIANNGTVGALDFHSPESFAPATARLTVTRTTSGARHGMSYYAGADCSISDMYHYDNVGTNFTMRGIPAAHQRATDYHHVWAYESIGRASRFVNESFHTLADRVIALPPALPLPTVTELPAAHKRVQATLALPSEYRDEPVLLLVYYPLVFVTGTAAWFDGASVTLAVPDFGAVTGWRSSFAPAAGNSVGWLMRATGRNAAAANGGCAENARFFHALVGGNS